MTITDKIDSARLNNFTHKQQQKHVKYLSLLFTKPDKKHSCKCADCNYIQLNITKDTNFFGIMRRILQSKIQHADSDLQNLEIFKHSPEGQKFLEYFKIAF